MLAGAGDQNGGGSFGVVGSPSNWLRCFMQNAMNCVSLTKRQTGFGKQS